jgi:hypothetical protein
LSCKVETHVAFPPSINEIGLEVQRRGDDV